MLVADDSGKITELTVRLANHVWSIPSRIESVDRYESLIMKCDGSHNDSRAYRYGCI